MAIFTETCTVELRAGGSETIPEGNWKVIGASGIATANGAGGVTVPSCVVTVDGQDCVESFLDAATGATLANNFSAKSVFYAAEIDGAHAQISSGSEVAVVVGSAFDSNQAVFQIVLKRT